MDNHYQPIDCGLHDYLEIACLYHYQLRIELTDGQCLEGRALTTETREQAEFLHIETQGKELSLRLDQLLAITPLEAGARFGRILLSNRPKCGC